MPQEKLKNMKDVIGEKYNMLEIIDNAPSRREPSGKLVKRVIVKCDCGNTNDVSYKSLKRSKVKSCGCLAKKMAEESKIPVSIGDTFNYWTLVEEVGRIKDKRSFKVQCVCGKEDIKPLHSLRKNISKSCGCKKEIKPRVKIDKTTLPIPPLDLYKVNSNNKTNWTITEEISAKRNEKGEIKRTVKAQCKCGHIKETLIENVKQSKQCIKCATKENKENYIPKEKDKVRERLNAVYNSMKDRCNNPTCKSYKSYGEKGVIVEESFDTFTKFYEWAINNGYELNKGLEIDRINGGNYSVENCRWVSKSENNLNSKHIKLTLEDVVWIRSEEFSLEESLRKFNCSKYTIMNIRNYITFKDL